MFGGAEAVAHTVMFSEAEHSGSGGNFVLESLKCSRRGARGENTDRFMFNLQGVFSSPGALHSLTVNQSNCH